jgi:thioesterase domain-containing protein
VYGLRAPGVDRSTPPLGTVEALAEYYVNEIRRVQPEGPYRLGGFCFSGLVAYEMARLFLESGETIDLLALLDTYPFRRRQSSRIDVERVKWQAFKNTDREGKWAWVRRRAGGPARKVRRAVYETRGPLVYERLVARSLQHRMPHRPWNLVLVASNLARRRYVPRPLDARVEFFRAQQTGHTRPTPWDGLALRGVELRSIVAPDMDHDLMMKEPHVRMLAAQLERALDSTEAG